MNESLWRKIKLPPFPKVADSKSKTYDAIVIGGGITGVVAAYLLKKSGLKVALLERNRIGGAETGSTSAHLTCVTDLRVKQLVDGFGPAGARFVWQAGLHAIDEIETLVETNDLGCDFKRVSGFLHSPRDSSQTDNFEQESEIARALGMECDFLTSVPIAGKPGIEFKNQAKIHPLLFLKGLAALIPGDGCELFENSPVTKINGRPLQVHCNNVVLQTEKVLVATHVPIEGNENVISASLFQTKIASYSSYIVGARLPKGKYPEVCLWDTADPYSYTRVDHHENDDYVIFGGKDHKTGQNTDTEKCFSELESSLREIFPDAEIETRWSGQVVETHDGLPFIGEITPGQFVATGFSGNGLTFGTFSALMFRDWVLQQKNPGFDLFSPHRKELHAGGIVNYLRENKDFPTYFLLDRLKSLDSLSEDQLKKGEGKVMLVNKKRVACSRDEHGKMHTVSAICPHMGCVVRWNGAEQTWDCPCHGSRFQNTGELMAGPAEKGLERV